MKKLLILAFLAACSVPAGERTQAAGGDPDSVAAVRIPPDDQCLDCVPLPPVDEDSLYADTLVGFPDTVLTLPTP